jgi:hypothetical protein
MPGGRSTLATVIYVCSQHCGDAFYQGAAGYAWTVMIVLFESAGTSGEFMDTAVC